MTQSFDLQGSGEVAEDWALVMVVMLVLVVLVEGKERVDGLELVEGCFWVVLLWTRFRWNS